MVGKAGNALGEIEGLEYVEDELISNKFWAEHSLSLFNKSSFSPLASAERLAAALPLGVLYINERPLAIRSYKDTVGFRTSDV